MHEQLEADELEAQPVQVLHFWQVFVVRPTGPCFLPLPGPNFRIFIGMAEHGARIVRTNEIVAFDARTATGKCASGERYQLSAKVGFTEDMQQWFKRRLFLAAAGAADATTDVLWRIKNAQASPSQTHSGQKSARWP
jgi:hypothetical protein